MPDAPRSPRPRMRSPSVTTMTFTSRVGQLCRIFSMWPRSLREIYNAARPAENVAEFLARLADGGRVNDRHHLFQMVHDHAVKQRLVPVLQADDLDVAFEVAGLAAEIVHHALHLLVHGLDVRRQQAAQAERVAFRLGEGGAFVENGVVQPVHALWRAGRGRRGWFWMVEMFCVFMCINGLAKN